MRYRYEHWVYGLQWDWLISRQRYFGVPFPVWYCSKCDKEILARKEDLPVDPLVDKPPVSKCPACGCTKFKPEKDVLDTWATSSLTPQISTRLVKDKKMQEKLYPMILRPQAHDIITFWLFNTVVKSRLHNKVNPWRDVVISGHAQDPHGRKMSKSKGNVVEPQLMIERYSADALRFWAAGSKLGEDLPFKEKDLLTGQKFITKLWNASKFSFMHLEDYAGGEAELTTIDKWLLTKLNRVIEGATESFEGYEYFRTKAETEKFFWQVFCDYYLEIIKERLYKPEKRGLEPKKAAQFTLYHSLLTILKLMAPIMPYITEELYQTHFRGRENAKSVHTTSWPKADERFTDEEAEAAGDMAVEIIGSVRKHKSDKSMPLGSELEKIVIEADGVAAERIKLVLDDIKGTGRIKNVEIKGGESGFKIIFP